MRKILSFLTAILFAGSMMATDYQLVTSASDLEAGAHYVIGAPYNAKFYVMSTTDNGNNRKMVEATMADGVITGADDILTLTLGGAADAWTFATDNYLGTAGYLNATSTTGSNYLKVVADLDAYAYFTIAIADGVTTVTCNGKDSRNILYLNGTTCFACYNNQTGAQYVKPSLYKEVQEGPKTYWTVAGDSEVAFGTTWAPTNKANDMVKQEDGSYKWEKTELELAAGMIKFKVCKDHDWAEAYPADNYELLIPESGIYTVTITFNPESKAVAAEATKTGEAVVLPTVVLHGNFFGDWKDTDPFAPAENKETAELTLSLKKGIYEFGFKFDGAWKANGANITRAENTANLSTGDGNMHITADEEGDYVFTYTFETQGLVVAYPAKTIPEDYEAIFAYNGKGTTKAEEVIYEGGTLTAYGYGQPGPEGMNTNMTYNSSQKGNMTIKIGKGYHKDAAGEGYYFMGITLDKALEEGDLLQIAAFRTGDKDCVFGLDFNAEADSAAATDECQYLFENNLQILSSNGVPTDEVIDIPACAVGAKYIRLYRKSGSTGLYIANFSVFRKKGGEPEKEYELKNCWDDGEWKWKATVKDGDDYKLENVVFGGQGVNWREVGSATDGTWVPVADFLGDNTIAKFDTVTLALNPTAGTITATLIGKYIDPTPADPTVTVIGDMTEWAAEIPFELSEDKKKATLFNDNIKKGTYAFKLKVNGDWRSNGYEYHRGFPGAAGISGDNENNMSVVIDLEGAYTFEWYFENDSLAIIYPEPALTNGYYLMGSFNDWKAVAENLFQSNLEAEGEEFVLSINLTAGDEIKVAWIENDAATTWFPKDGNYTVDKNHSGPTTMYFRPVYNEAWAAFGGYFYIVPTSTEGIEETLAEGKAVKVVRDGQVLILKADSTFNVMGQRVK